MRSKTKPASDQQATYSGTAKPPAGLALYAQVRDFINQKISDGTWQAGDKLPSENDLVKQFGVARMTVNRALKELSQQGLIFRVAGVGSFVNESQPQSTLLQIANLADEIKNRGHIYTFELIKIERIAASSEVASALDLNVGDSVFHSVCVHHENNIPVQLENRYVNPKAVPLFIEQDFATTTPSEYLLKQVAFDQIEHVVDAVLPTAEQCQLLKMQANHACLLLTRRTWLRQTAITYVKCLHPGNRYRLGGRFLTDGKNQAT